MLWPLHVGRLLWGEPDETVQNGQHPCVNLVHTMGDAKEDMYISSMGGLLCGAPMQEKSKRVSRSLPVRL